MFALNPAVAAATALSLLSSISHAQILPIDQFFNLTTFPNEQSENVTRYLNEAADLATDRLIYQYFQDQCITQQLYPKLFSFPPASSSPSPLSKTSSSSATASSPPGRTYNTTAGLVLIDALDNPSEIDAILLPALAKFGFQGADIKHVIITHEHVDHYGGAKYLQDSFWPTIYASRAAWDALAGLGPTADPVPPAEDAVVADGDVVLTPGHTPGTLSLIFPVREGEAEHVAGLSGGTGTPADAGARAQKVESQYRFAAVARERGVDTLVSNHQVADHALFLADLLAHRGAGKPNPFVVGVDNFERYMKINGLCSRVIAAREGMDLHA
ncbi:beta-lactamase-like protein [Macrophomina phaseolina]|uniref:Beta-lactamase-like protein n=1 Tax=Macrophomina phaseolina TaxID=35725 RepID=A0ABQ8G7V3_9PEZI|nr:beta-lactamase-like protein [Macrophomina phaseolina]